MTSGIGHGDLQAVVRGWCVDGSWCSSPLRDTQKPGDQNDDDDEFVFSNFPDHLFETNDVLDELEELYKPFYPNFLNPLSPQNSLSSSSNTSVSTGKRSLEPEKEQVESEPFFSSGSTPNVAAAQVKHKKRKTQHKTVVVQVRAEGSLSSDTWAWRKYGQKPIKGSPHPRSYYRCSSSKGCLARKQVERSQLDPEMFVITYTAEHCHSQPTRRSALAGTTRHKFSAVPPKASSNVGDDDHPHDKPPIPKDSPFSSAIQSPQVLPSTLLGRLEDEYFSIQASKKESTVDGGGELQRVDGRENNGLVVWDMIFDNDFLAGLDEFDGLISSDVACNGAFCASRSH